MIQYRGQDKVALSMDGPLPLFDWAGVSLPSCVLAEMPSLAQKTAEALGRPFLAYTNEAQNQPVHDAQTEFDLSGGIVGLVPSTRHSLLNRRMTEFLLRSCGAVFLRVGFALERRGIAFMGDLVQLPRHRARQLIHSHTLFGTVEQSLARYRLGFGMAAPGWDRPPDSFSRRLRPN